MNATELLKKLDGHVTGGKAMVRINDKNTIVGRIIDGTLVLNEEGRGLADKLENAAPKTRKPRASKADAEVETEADAVSEE